MKFFLICSYLFLLMNASAQAQSIAASDVPKRSQSHECLTVADCITGSPEHPDWLPAYHACDSNEFQFRNTYCGRFIGLSPGNTEFFECRNTRRINNTSLYARRSCQMVEQPCEDQIRTLEKVKREMNDELVEICDGDCDASNLGASERDGIATAVTNFSRCFATRVRGCSDWVDETPDPYATSNSYRGCQAAHRAWDSLTRDEKEALRNPGGNNSSCTLIPGNYHDELIDNGRKWFDRTYGNDGEFDTWTGGGERLYQPTATCNPIPNEMPKPIKN